MGRRDCLREGVVLSASDHNWMVRQESEAESRKGNIKALRGGPIGERSGKRLSAWTRLLKDESDKPVIDMPITKEPRWQRHGLTKKTRGRIG